MDVEFIFRRISQKLLADFEISAQINHQGIKGTYRENALKRFLQEGKLPGKYSIGSGEIISPLNQVSKQSDLIIFDSTKCPAWIIDQDVQVFPIEGIYGVIEVKSELSKEKLYEGLEVIKNLKRMTPRGRTISPTPMGNILINSPIPFGIIFAYRLKDNSLESLKRNLEDYQKNNPPETWANLIVVLGEGVIFNVGKGFSRILKSEELHQTISPIAFHFKQDALFEFYSALLSILSSMHLGEIDINKYRDLPSKVGEYLVRGYYQTDDTGKVFTLGETFISKMVEFCHKKGKLTHKEIFELTSCANLEAFSEEQLSAEYYLYDPENLPCDLGLIQSSIVFDELGRPRLINPLPRMKVPLSWIEIDGEFYYFPCAYLTQNDFVEINKNLF